MYSKKSFGINTLSCSEGSTGLRPNVLAELGDKEFLVLTDQYNIEIFSCCLRLLSSCSSTHPQNNIASTQIYSEDHLSVSRIRSSHLLEVILRAEEECLVFCHWVRLIELSSWFNISLYSFTNRYSSCR